MKLHKSNGVAPYTCTQCGERIRYERGADPSCVGAYFYVSLLTGRRDCSGITGLDSAGVGPVTRAQAGRRS